MAPRKAGPVLLELIRDSSRPTPGVAAPAEPSSGGMWNWAGRTIRVPAGYVFVVAAVVAAVGLLGYVIGYGRAERIAEGEAARRAQQSIPVTDPLDQSPLNLNLTSPQPERPLSDPVPSRPVSGSGIPAEARPAGPAGAPPDPREASLNYYVIVRDLPSEGARLVAWLGEQGVPALTEPVSGGLVKVVVTEGFARGQASSAQALSYKEHLRELGRRWKRDQKGSSDFSDLYLEKYRDEDDD